MAGALPERNSIAPSLESGHFPSATRFLLRTRSFKLICTGALAATLVNVGYYGDSSGEFSFN
jgi:hypothetical protein